MSIEAERQVRDPVQVEDLIEDTKDRIAGAVLIVDEAETAMKTARRAYDHEFARAMLAADGPEYMRKAEATQVAMTEKETADEAEIAFHHAEREAKSLEKELFAWQSILNSVRSMWNATGGRAS
jgi:hypothetical protein